MTTNELTPYQKQQVLAAIVQCNDFIAKEAPRAEDLRPVEVQKLLTFYYAHREKLLGMLNGTVAVPTSPFREEF